MKKNCIIFIVFFAVLALNTVYSQANEEIYESTNKQEKKDNITYPQEVTIEMKNASYWTNKLGKEADKLLLNTNEIKVLNQSIINEKATSVNDITKITEDMTQAERKNYVINEMEKEFNYMVRNYPNKDRQLYVDGKLIDNIPYFENMKKAISTTGFEDNNKKVQLYAVGTKRTEVKMFPTKAIWGYDEPDDPDDESCYTTIEVNEPFVIRAKCTINNDTFYWGLSNSYAGWVNAEHLALFDSKDEWIKAWKVDLTGKDFLVVTQDNIILEPSKSAPKTSEVQLKLGTVLKLVPKNEIPESVNSRSTLNNYVVYLPTRNEEGKYVKSYALIAEHYSVSIGYLPLTQRNLLNIAFSCLGNRYGWGGMLGSMDCSSYAKAMYKCFGIDMPRDTDNQESIPNRIVSLENMTDKEKDSYIKQLPIGTVLYMPGHAMVYIGYENGKNYVISDTGSLSDTNGEVNVRTMYSVIINPLTVRKRNGNTWLTNLTSALVFGKKPSKDSNNIEPSDKDVYITVDETVQKQNITYSNGVTSDMSNSSYWKGLLNEKDKLILNTEEIKDLNKQLNEKEGEYLTSKSVLVVAQDKIVLEPSVLQPEVSEVNLPMGTVLELVPEDKIPTSLAERGPWYNHVVYLPITNKNGEIEKKFALIPAHYNVSIGYLSLTAENIIDISLRCLGDSNELMSNTQFISSVYKCFGMELSMNSDMEDKLKEKMTDISSLNVEEKTNKIKNIPVGSILKLGNEYAIYLGNQEGNYYIISSMNDKINSIVLSKVEIESLTHIIDFTNKIEAIEKKEEVTQPDVTKNDEQITPQSEEKTVKTIAEPVTTEIKTIETSSNNPKTGDDIAKWYMLGAISFIGIILTIIYKMKINDKNK